MKEINDGGPAFPFKCQGPTTAPEFYYGMTLRDYFAGQALAGLSTIRDLTTPSTVEIALQMADEMIAARNAQLK